MDATGHDSPRDTIIESTEGVLSSGRDRGIRRRRGENISTERAATPLDFLHKLIRPYATSGVTRAMDTLLAGQPVTDYSSIVRLISLSDALRPMAKDTVLVYETYVENRFAGEAFPGSATEDERLDAMRLIREENERDRPKEPEPERLTDNWYVYRKAPKKRKVYKTGTVYAPGRKKRK